MDEAVVFEILLSLSSPPLPTHILCAHGPLHCHRNIPFNHNRPSFPATDKGSSLPAETVCIEPSLLRPTSSTTSLPIRGWLSRLLLYHSSPYKSIFQHSPFLSLCCAAAAAHIWLQCYRGRRMLTFTQGAIKARS